MSEPGSKPPKRQKSRASTRLTMKSAVMPSAGAQKAGKAVGMGLILDGNGHPTNLTPEIHERIIADMKTHCDWPAMTAYRCGVSPVTLEQWVARGADPYAVEPYRGFVADFVAAEATVHGELVGIILATARGGEQEGKSPAWAAWLLKHRWGYLWNLNRETGTSNAVTVAQVVDQVLSKFSAERREKATAIIKQLSEEARASARKEGFLL